MQYFARLMRIGHHRLYRHFDHRSDERGRHTMSGDVHGQLHDQLVTAAYLWLDTGNRKALYSAAGHPPLLRWREGKLAGIAMVCCSESTQRPTTPFVTYRSTLATASCFTQTA